MYLTEDEKHAIFDFDQSMFDARLDDVLRKEVDTELRRHMISV